MIAPIKIFIMYTIQNNILLVVALNSSVSGGDSAAKGCKRWNCSQAVTIAQYSRLLNGGGVCIVV